MFAYKIAARNVERTRPVLLRRAIRGRAQMSLAMISPREGVVVVGVGHRVVRREGNEWRLACA